MFCCDSLALYLMNVQGVDTTANQKEIVQLFAGLPFWLAFLLTTPLPALAEEVVFRGYLYKKLFGEYRLVGLLLTSFLFGLLHGPTDWLSWFIYSSSGFVLGYVYYRTDYLVYPLAIHLMNNGIATIVHYFFTK
ncbi:CPBP family intramembrane metalloprotease [Streptococcus oriscaviae]|uniref:CPBP family intramembrane metalloprotease n=2 Tax=Streptococcus oriscaviae TaxID=2781599 RepID=A0ABX7YNV8_9STRE|nr:CPBP family intramembrane metalloprotease [Streptococcus oriscaviae]